MGLVDKERGTVQITIAEYEALQNARKHAEGIIETYEKHVLEKNAEYVLLKREFHDPALYFSNPLYIVISPEEAKTKIDAEIEYKKHQMENTLYHEKIKYQTMSLLDFIKMKIRNRKHA